MKDGVKVARLNAGNHCIRMIESADATRSNEASE
jgi:hypothetical protein